MSALAEKLRKARETRVEVAGHVFIVRRPTDVEAQRLKTITDHGDLIPFVVGWENVREIDVLSSGDAHPLKFDAEVCREWLVDRPDLLGKVVDGIVGAYKAHREALEAAEKN